MFTNKFQKTEGKHVHLYLLTFFQMLTALLCFAKVSKELLEKKKSIQSLTVHRDIAELT